MTKGGLMASIERKDLKGIPGFDDDGVDGDIGGEVIDRESTIFDEHLVDVRNDDDGVEELDFGEHHSINREEFEPGDFSER
jgi:hypothetical protein